MATWGRGLILAGCAACAPAVEGDVGAGPAVPGQVTAAVLATATDAYDVGALTTVTLDGWEVADVATLHGDAVVAVEGGRVWAINRLQVDSVRAYTPGSWAVPELEVGTGRASNPHDVAWCDGALFVSRYARDHLLVLDPATGEELGQVDLAAEADADGIPEASDLVVDGDHVLVALQRLDRDQGWVSTAGGRVVAVDCARREVVERWDVGPNPELAAWSGGVVVIAEDGVRRLGEEALLLDRVDGAQVVDLALGPDGRGALVAREGARHVVACVDADTWTPHGVRSLSHYVADVAVHAEGEAWLAVRRGWEDPTSPGGVMVLDVATCEERTGGDWIRGRFAPFSVAFY